MNENIGEIICVWGGRKNLKINGGEVHGCPLRARGNDGTVALPNCKLCASHAGTKKKDSS